MKRTDKMKNDPTEMKRKMDEIGEIKIIFSTQKWLVHVSMNTMM